MKRKIMHIVQSNGGVERYLFMLLKNMDVDKFQHILVCSKQYEYKKFKRFVSFFEQVDMEREISLGKDVKAILELRRIIKKHRPDILYLHSSKAGALGRLANIGIQNQVVYNPHGWAFSMDCSNKKKLFYKLVERALSFSTDIIIAISEDEKRTALSNKVCHGNKIKVIWNGIDINEYARLKKDFNIKKVDVGIPKEAYVIGMVGRLSNQKAPDIMIKSANIIKKSIPNAFFVFVGDGEKKEEVLSLAKEHKLDKCVLITGWVDEPLKYINLFDQAMLLSRWEGFGLVLAEYMISGKPIIGTKTGAIPTIIKDGFNGRLVEKNDFYAVAKESLELYHNAELRKKFIKNGLITVKKRFNIIRVVNEHERIFTQLYYKKVVKSPKKSV